jgi:hypothetical protein
MIPLSVPEISRLLAGTCCGRTRLARARWFGQRTRLNRVNALDS